MPSCGQTADDALIQAMHESYEQLIVGYAATYLL